jgi:hypothetical protein
MSEDGSGNNGQSNGGDAAAVANAVANQNQQGNGGNGQGGDGQNQTPTWSFAENVPGTGDVPEWFKSDKYNSVSAQAQAYTELEKKFGAFTGSPDKYEVSLSDEIKEKGITIDSEDPLLPQAYELGKELGMNQEGFNKMMNLYAMSMVAENEATEQHRSDEIASLGDNGQERVNNLDAWGKANLPAELYEGFKEMPTTAAGVKALERMIAMASPGSVSADPATTQVQGLTMEQYKEGLTAVDEHGNRKMQDPEYRKNFRERFNNFLENRDS